MGQVAADPRKIQLTGRRAPKFTKERVCKARHEPSAAAFHGNEVHLFGKLEVVAVYQVAEHVHLKRLALRQCVDDQGNIGGKPAQLAPNHTAEAVRHRDTLVPHPHPGHLPHPAGRDLILEQLPNQQRVPAGQLPKPFGATAIHRTPKRGLNNETGICRRQRLQINAGQQMVFPQRRYRIGLIAAGAYGDQQSNPGHLSQLVHHVSR